MFVTFKRNLQNVDRFASRRRFDDFMPRDAAGRRLYGKFLTLITTKIVIILRK